MRDIKFRAWDKPGRLMVYSGEQASKDLDGDDRQYWTYLVPSVNAGKFYEVTLLDNGSLEKEQYEGVLMQYTGLKDKNGKEIYEGDILQNPDGHKGIVNWNDKDAGFFCQSLFDPPKKYYEQSEEEVIGNIYENKELLK